MPNYYTVALRGDPLAGAPTLSIILPLHNCGADLHVCFELLARTELPDTELIVVDDGSRDHTLARAEAVSAGFPRMRLMSTPSNGGVARARNAALAEATGRFVWFLDWDDDWEPTIMTRLLSAADVNDADLVVCGATRNADAATPGPRIDGLTVETVLSGPEAFDRLLRGEINGYLWNKLMRRGLAQQLVFPPMTSLSDIAGLVPVLAGARRVATVPSVLYRHIVRPGSITNSTPAIENWFTARDVVRSVADGLGRRDPHDLGLCLYDFLVAISVVNTILRLDGHEQLYRDTIERVVREVRWRDVVRVTAHDPVLAGRVALVKCCGRRYKYVYSVYTGVRSRVRGTR